MKALPNIISIFRICLVPQFVAAFVLDDNDIKYFAIGIFIVANASDVLDGIIARRLNAQSTLGKVLDPLGDKLINFTALICITTLKPILLWAVIIFFVKEILMGIGGLLIHKRAKIELPASHWLGKAATVTFFLVCVTLLIWVSIPTPAAIALVSAAVCLMLAAFVKYIHTYMTIMKRRALPDDVQIEREGED